MNDHPTPSGVRPSRSCPRALAPWARPSGGVVLVLLLPGLLALAVASDSRAFAGPGDAVPPALLTESELDELVAPVALYPDVVLDSMLPATTDPLGVVAAARHAEKGAAVPAPPEDARWDPGVVALLQFPDVLRWMSDNLPWLERMGFAMSNQPSDVLAAVQRVRARAWRPDLRWNRGTFPTGSTLPVTRWTWSPTPTVRPTWTSSPTRTTDVTRTTQGEGYWTWRSNDRWRPAGPTPRWHLGDGVRVERQVERGNRSLDHRAPRSEGRRR